MTAGVWNGDRGSVGLSVQVSSEDRRVGWTVSSDNCSVQREAVGMGAQGPAESREGQWAWEFMSMVREQRCSGYMGVCTCRGQRVSESL